MGNDYDYDGDGVGGVVGDDEVSGEGGDVGLGVRRASRESAGRLGGPAGAWRV